MSFYGWLTDSDEYFGIPWQEVDVIACRRIVDRIDADFSAKATCLLEQIAYDNGVAKLHAKLDRIERRQEKMRRIDK